MRILLTSVGRRGYLARFFKQALGSDGEVWGGDLSPHASAFHDCDHQVLLPEVIDSHYADELLGFCQAHQVDMVVPLIDPELLVLARERDRFFDAGVMAVVSPLQTIEIAADKYLTYQFCLENGIPVPMTTVSLSEAQEFLSEGRLEWPLVVKPRGGSASSDIYYCSTLEELRHRFELCPEPMIQQAVKGLEYGYDLFSDASYRPISVYCKQKLAMRAGETDKAVSTNDPKLIDLGLKLAANLELFGPLDADVMVGPEGPQVLELNPRFGGGYPCSHLCGAAFPEKLLKMARGEALSSDIGSCPNGVVMFKQDEILCSDEQSLRLIASYRDFHEEED